MIRHLYVRLFKAYSTQTLSSTAAVHTSNTNPPNEHFRVRGTLSAHPEGQEGLFRKRRVEIFLNHFQKAAEVDVAQGTEIYFFFL